MRSNRRKKGKPLNFEFGMPHRFRTKEDAVRFCFCVDHFIQVPEDLSIAPFMKFGEEAIPNPEYTDAPFEIRYGVLMDLFPKQ